MPTACSASAPRSRASVDAVAHGHTAARDWRTHCWYQPLDANRDGAADDLFAPLVIDLSSLWAGPLCAQLLAGCGARVIKVESTARPDGARRGPARFYDLLNVGKESVALDFRDPADRKRLHALLAQADIVIESARPRALEQLGIHAAQLLVARPGMVWLGITGYGRRAPMRDWIAYGDDAGVDQVVARAHEAGCGC